MTLLLLAEGLFACGCTSALWDEGTFAQFYQPAHPTNLRLFYSKERQDVLVQYDEWNEGDAGVRARCFWLEPNIARVSQDRKPHFVSDNVTNGLMTVQVSDSPEGSAPTGAMDVHAVARPDQDSFTLYVGDEELAPYSLPFYRGSSQKVKQVLLTPFAVAVDLTIVGAVIAYFSAPEILSGLSR